MDQLEQENQLRPSGVVLGWPHTGIRYNQRMIVSFGDKRTEALFQDAYVADFQEVARRAKRKLEALHAAARIEDMALPPSNRLERLRGDLKDFHSVRVNDRWRVIFRWRDGHAHDVRVVDYH